MEQRVRLEFLSSCPFSIDTPHSLATGQQLIVGMHFIRLSRLTSKSTWRACMLFIVLQRKRTAHALLARM